VPAALDAIENALDPEYDRMLGSTDSVG